MKFFRSALFLMIFLCTGILVKAEIKIPEMKTETLDINGNERYEIIKPVFNDNIKFKEVNDEINKLVDINKIRTEEKDKCAEDPDGCEKHMYQVTPEIVYADNNVISLVIDIFIYDWGAHGGGWRYSFLADRKSGKLITNTLKDNNKEVFVKIQKFIEQNNSFYQYLICILSLLFLPENPQYLSKMKSLCIYSGLEPILPHHKS